MQHIENRRKVATVKTTVSTITLNVRGLNAPNGDGDCQSERKMKPNYIAIPEYTLSMNTHTDRLWLNDWRQIYHANSNEKKAGVTILFSEWETSQQGKLSGIKEALHNDKWGNSPPKDIKVLSVYAPNHIITLCKAEIDNTTMRKISPAIMIGDFNITLSEMDVSSYQKTSKSIVELKNIHYFMQQPQNTHSS